jgi:RNA polymerase sigma-70 factor (ECF subfamily)
MPPSNVGAGFPAAAKSSQRVLYFRTAGVLVDRATSVEHVRATRLFAVTEDSANAEVVAVFRHACESHLPAVFSYVRYRVHSADIAEELTSTVFVRALERLPSFDPSRGEMLHWIFRIARNVVTDHLRAGRRWPVVPIEWVSERGSSDATPERAVAESEVQDRLMHSLKRLRQRDRDVIGMKFGADLTNRDIARVTGLTEGHVAVLIRRALNRLKTLLESHGVSHV